MKHRLPRVVPTRRLTVCMLAGVLALSALAASAHEGATGLVKERMDSMSAIAESMKALGGMVKSGEVDGAQAVALGARVAEEARKVPDLFAQEELQPMSEARPEIWQDFADFTAKAEAMSAAAATLAAQAPATLDRATLGKALGDIGATCKACHEVYRVKKN